MGNLRRLGRPKTNWERLVSHYGLKSATDLVRTYGNEAYNFLPERGSRVSITQNKEFLSDNPYLLNASVDARNYALLSDNIEFTKYGQPKRGYFVGQTLEDTLRNNAWANLNTQNVKVVFKNKEPYIGMTLEPFGKVVGVDKVYTSELGTFWVVWAGQPGQDTVVLYALKRRHHPEFAYVIGNQIDQSVDGIKEWLEENLPKLQSILDALKGGEPVTIPEPIPQPSIWDTCKKFWYVPVLLLGGTIVLITIMGPKGKRTTVPVLVKI